MLKFILAGLVGVVLLLGVSGWAYSIMRVREITQAYPPIGRFVDVAGTRLHLLEGGTGVPVVMLHGASANLREWTATIFDDVARDFHAIAIDRPGHGWSKRNGTDGHDPRIQARAVHAALREIGVERPILVAHSWSGTLAMAYALEFGEDLRGIVLLAGVTHPWPGGVGTLHEVGSLPVVGDLFGRTVLTPAYGFAGPGAIENAFAPNPVPEDYAEEAGVTLYLQPETFVANSRDLTQLKRVVEAMAPDYARIDVPVVGLYGADDRVILPALHGPPLADKIGGAEITVLDGVGHMIHHVRGDLVLDAIRSLAAR